MKRLLFLAIPLLLILILLPTGITYAAPQYDRIIREGDTVDEDVVIFGGTLVIQNGAHVTGDVAAFGSTVTIAGVVEGDVAIFGGSTDMTGTVEGDLVIVGSDLGATTAAEVEGDCVLVGGNVERDGSGGLNCSAFGEFPPITVPAITDIPIIPTLPRLPTRGEVSFGFLGRVGDVAGQSLLFGLFALILAAVAPRQVTRVSSTISSKPVASGAIGFLTVVAAISLLVVAAILTALLILVCIGVLGIPIVLGLMLMLGLGLFMGWASAGVVLGNWLARRLKLSNRRLTVTAALGTAVLTLAAGLLSSLPFYLGGWIWTMLVLAVTCAGLGAVALTRFGTRIYPPVRVSNGDKVEIVMQNLPDDELPPK